MISRYNEHIKLIMDIRDCLTVAHGLLQISKSNKYNLSSNNICIAIEHLNNANEKLSQLLNNYKQNTPMQKKSIC